MAVYYLDAARGDDDGGGLSPERPLRTLEAANRLRLGPGDQLLLRRGCVFFGCLRPAGSGTADNPLVVSAYGEGEAPQIVARAADGEAVYLGGDGVELRQLGIQNPGGEVGIRVHPDRDGPARHIVIRDCVLQQIATRSYSHETGGILAVCRDGGPRWFEDFRIENNRFHMVSRSGVSFTDPVFPGEDGKPVRRYHRRIVVRGNDMTCIGGDGVVIIGGKDVLIEKNRLLHAQFDDHQGSFCAGLWPMHCIDTVMQYNEVGYTRLGKGGDGQGFDVDSDCRNTVVQYNYSHHNDGGFLLLCTGEARDIHTGTQVRYNLSVDDACVPDRAVITISSPVRHVCIHHNTFYFGAGSAPRFKLLEAADYCQVGSSEDVVFSQNLFVAGEEKDIRYNFEKQIGYRFEENRFASVPLPADPAVVCRDNRTQDAERLADAGAAGIGRETGRCYRPLRREEDGLTPAGAGERDYFGAPVEGRRFCGAIFPGEWEQP